MRTQIDMDGMKAKLPQELRIAMRLDDDQFEELELDVLQCVMEMIPSIELCQFSGPVDMQMAWRPTRNPADQYYALTHSIAIDPEDSSVRHEIKAFKPMDKQAYRKYCIAEFGADPFINHVLN